MIWETICWLMSSESRIAFFLCLLSSRISSSISRRTTSMSLPLTCEMKRVYSSSSACTSISWAASQLSSAPALGTAVDGPAAGGLGERDHRASPGSASESDESGTWVVLVVVGGGGGEGAIGSLSSLEREAAEGEERGS